MIVDRAAHPRITEVLDILSSDNYCGPTQPRSPYTVPGTWNLDLIERSLSNLSPEELETFACGEGDEVAALAARSWGLQKANEFLEYVWDKLTP